MAGCFPIGVGAQFSELQYDSGGGERADEVLLLGDRIVLAGNTDAEVVDRLTGIFHVLDLEGNVLRTQRLASSGRSSIRAATVTDNGACLLGAWDNTRTTIDEMAFNRISTSGEAVSAWRFGYPEDDEEIRDLIAVGGDRYLAVGNIGTTNKASAILFTGAGEMLWWRTFSIEGSRFNIFTNAVADGDEVAITGHTVEDNREVTMLYVRLSLGGELVANRSYDIPGERGSITRSLFKLPDGNLVASTSFAGDGDPGNTVVLTLNSAGDVIGQFAFGRRGNEVITDGALLPDGNYLFAGAEVSDLERRPVIIRTTPAGEVISSQLLSADADVFISCLSDGPAGGYLLSGSSSCQGGERDMVLFQLTPTFERPDGCTFADPAWVRQPSPEVKTRAVGTLERRLPQGGGALGLANGAPPITRAITCPVFDLDADDSSGAPEGNSFLIPPFCYDEPFALVDGDLDLGAQAPDSISVSLRSPGELLLTETTVRFRRNGTGTLFLYPADLQQTRLALRSLRVRLDDPEASVGEGQVQFIARYGCDRVGRAITYFETETLLSASINRDTLLCPGEAILLDATRPNASTYNWEAEAVTEAILPVTAPGAYVATVANDCSSVRDTFTVTVSANVLSAPPVNDLTFCLGDSALVDLSATGAEEFSWQDGFAGPQRSILSTADFSVRLANDCQQETLTFSIRAVDCCRLYVPNAFSPNGDGINDTFRPQLATSDCDLFNDYELTVFDRWGGEVFRSNDIEVGWGVPLTGNTAGAQTGAYTYALRYHNGLATIRRAGVVMLVR